MKSECCNSQEIYLPWLPGLHVCKECGETQVKVQGSFNKYVKRCENPDVRHDVWRGHKVCVNCGQTGMPIFVACANFDDD